jgi:manganese/zinc/iron transport system permease protein
MIARLAMSIVSLSDPLLLAQGTSLLAQGTSLLAQGTSLLAQSKSITDRRVSWPTWEQWQRVLLLEDYNTRVVVFGAAALGCAAGMVGCFALLRKRALMGDAISHATLPGIALAFMFGTSVGWDAKSLPLLLCGATVTGLIGVAVILTLRNMTRLKEDTALGIVLSVFFGAGIALLDVAQRIPGGHAAGLDSFIFGKTASMGAADAKLISVAALACIFVCVAAYKEFELLCFDESFAGSRGFSVILLDLLLMSTVVVISIVGLQAVGLVLMVALLIIPAAAARFWTEKLWQMMVIASVLGMLGGTVGAAASALFPKLPSGAMIVLSCAGFFLVSMVFGRSRGILVRSLRRRRVNRSIARQHLLRAMFELHESTDTVSSAIATLDELLPKRSWSQAELNRAIGLAQHAELVTRLGNQVQLTKKGRVVAERYTREHRLWELYLITHADIAPSQVDHEADRIEHVLAPEVVAELESILIDDARRVPQSPHELGRKGGQMRGQSEPTMHSGAEE